MIGLFIIIFFSKKLIQLWTQAPPIAVDSATGDEATDDDENNDSSVKKKGWKSKMYFHYHKSVNSN